MTMHGRSPFRQGFLGGLAALAVVALLFAVATAVAQDDTYDAAKDIDKDGTVDVLDVQSVAAAWNSVGSPRAPLVLFNTAATYTGAGPAPGGRTGMNDACRTEDPAAHFCSCYEIEYALSTAGVSFRSVDPAWVDCFLLATLRADFFGYWPHSVWDGYTEYPKNCRAWTDNTGNQTGYILDTAARGPSVSLCDATHPLACCK